MKAGNGGFLSGIADLTSTRNKRCRPSKDGFSARAWTLLLPSAAEEGHGLVRDGSPTPGQPKRLTYGYVSLSSLTPASLRLLVRSECRSSRAWDGSPPPALEWCDTSLQKPPSEPYEAKGIFRTKRSTKNVRFPAADGKKHGGDIGFGLSV